MSDPVLSSVLSVSKEQFHRIATAEWGNGNDGGTVVCVHGLTRQGRDFDWLARDLAARGRRVVCPDLVGRGRSDRLKHPADYGLAQYVTDMTVLIASCGEEKIDYVGTSLGGMIGILLAGRDNAPIRRLVINDVGPQVESRAAIRIGDYVRKAPAGFPTLEDASAFLRTVLAPFGNLTDEQWRHMAEHSLRRNDEGHWMMRFDRAITWAFRGPWHESPELWRAWDNIKCPILVLRGEHSDLLSEATCRHMVARNPRAKVVEIAGCGHAPALMDDAQVDLVAGWLCGKEGEPGREQFDPARERAALNA